MTSNESTRGDGGPVTAREAALLAQSEHARMVQALMHVVDVLDFEQSTGQQVNVRALRKALSAKMRSSARMHSFCVAYLIAEDDEATAREIEAYAREIEPYNRLAELRIAAGMRRLDVAAYVDRDPQTLYRWERGDAQIPDIAKHQLADLFGVSIPWLMGWESQQETGRMSRDETIRDVSGRPEAS